MKNLLAENKVKLNEYAHYDSIFADVIEAYFDNTINAEECILELLGIMSFDETRRIKDNSIFLDIVDNLLKNSEWIVNREFGRCGDFDPNNYKRWLEIVWRIYEITKQKIDDAEHVLNFNNEKPTFEKIKTICLRFGVPIIEEDYYNKEKLLEKKNYLKKTIEDHKYKPSDVINMIKENWDHLYYNRATYEAVEFCIVTSTKHLISDDFGMKISNFAYSIGKLNLENGLL